MRGKEGEYIEGREGSEQYFLYLYEQVSGS